MKNMKSVSCIALLALGLSGLTMLGCSVIGLTVGAIHDKNTPKRSIIPVDQATVLKPGTDVEVTLGDDTRIMGKYAGMELLSDKAHQTPSTESLTRLTAGKAVPVLDAIRIRDQTKVTIVPLNDVLQIDKVNERKGAETGFIAGLMIDMVFYIYRGNFKFLFIHAGD